MNFDEAKLRTIIREEVNTELTGFFGEYSRHFDRLLADFKQEVEVKFDRVFNTLDGIIGRLDTDEIERAALGVQLERHHGWIHQLADKTNTKLSAP